MARGKGSGTWGDASNPLRDADAFLTVVEDLTYLRRAWGEPGTVMTPPPDEVRRGAAILRRLLTEDLLGAAWRHCGFEKQPTITAPDPTHAKDYRSPTAVIALAGCRIRISDARLTGNDRFADPAPDRAFTLHEFNHGPCIVIGPAREHIKRLELVHYFANVRGGVHLETSRRRERKNEDLIRRIRYVEGAMVAFDMECVLRELLEVGRAAATAADVVLLCERIRAMYAPMTPG